MFRLRATERNVPLSSLYQWMNIVLIQVIWIYEIIVLWSLLGKKTNSRVLIYLTRKAFRRVVRTERKTWKGYS